MSFPIFLLAGGMIGWLAGLVMRTDGPQGVLLNVLIGAVGSDLGGLLLANAFGVPSWAQGAGFSLVSVAASLAGTILLLALWNFLARGRVR